MMKYRKAITYTTILAIIVGFYAIRSNLGQSTYPVVSAESVQLPTVNAEGIPYYLELQRQYAAASMKGYTGQPITVPSARILATKDGAKTATVKDSASGTDVLHWQNGAGAVEWEIGVPEEGLYNLEIAYKPESESSSSIFYGLQIDGKLPFAEAKSVEFLKQWQDQTFPYKKDVLGNEIRSQQEQVKEWKTMRYTDYNVSSQPIAFHLKAGKHTIRFQAVNEPMLWKSISLVAPNQIVSYKDYVKDKPRTQVDPQWFIKFEAEQLSSKSHTSIQTGTRNESQVSPDPKGRIIYNVIDGEKWKKPGEWIAWQIDVPETGWYELDTKYYQRFQGKTNVYRTVMIDGAVPFQEMLHYTFPYNDRLEIYTLQDAQGKPYQFYLGKGKHEIRMIADASLVDQAFLSLTSTISDVNTLEQELRKVTGDYGANAGDTYRTWDLDSYMPDISERLQSILDRLNLITDYLNGLNQSATTATNTIRMAAAMVEDLMEDVDKIPNKLKVFPDLKTRLSTWLDTYNDQSLTLDYLVLRAPEAKTGLKESNMVSQMAYSAGNFLRTFYQKYDTREENKKDGLEIWIGRNRDYAGLLQEMINQDFTPATGIKVNVNLMPDPNALTLSNAAGDQPDLALGVAQDTPVDFAMRGASADLKTFSDYEEVAARFNPGAMRNMNYNHGVYALPETQVFHLLFYRKSVMKGLGIEVPQTWDEVRKILPTLQEKGLSFFYPNKDYVPFFYMYGAEFYSRDGLKAAFETEEGYEAFKLWTDLFNKFDLPKDVPSFFNHFKLGDMPIGVSDYNTYLQLLSSAPEIVGDWGIAPIPGVKQADGEIARWSQNTMSSAMMLDKSDKKDKAWEFLKWWTSDAVQLQYGSEIESYYGIAYRWNTANMRALASMPWPSEDLAVIEEQNRWVKNVPNIPGGYFLSREMEFAWNRVVVNKLPPKDSLDKGAVSLEKEMVRKQKNLGILPTDNLNVETFNQPYDWGAVRQ
ncbi:ABC-type glycerol-3-phosphate transport system substrate-binding protein [Paenibacillus qinlingensis]|uniref:ABC-type glycerol-3-phosphate transport system substrate-binding protein n=2 Tax=Paenibacillus qinlingensis TaxID=1837343 RepID=A0ABU1NQF1_9BACL|nr:ABC-type glycerol-3-phosphate transport system substrate-binding protein [Paenibacillus qinlingensis]